MPRVHLSASNQHFGRNKSLGLVWIPGVMAGMLVSGASPVYAGIFQFIIVAMILSASGTRARSRELPPAMPYRRLDIDFPRWRISATMLRVRFVVLVSSVQTWSSEDGRKHYGAVPERS